jgi:predicted dehydrogenase
MAYRHGVAFDRVDECELVGAADIVRENAVAFADYFGIDEADVYEDYRAMLDEVRPGVVSISTPPDTHADIAVDCMRAASVDAIHCEKPMARTWADCERMVDVAEETGTNLTFNHQRRFGTPYRKAKELLDSGEIGDLERLEMAASNIYDYGSHSIDLCNYFNDEGRAEWVIGQIDYRQESRFFGAHNENQALAQWEYENGVEALAATGETGADLVNCHNRLVGSDGVIEIGPGFPNEESQPETVLRVKRDGDEEWEVHDVNGEGLHGPESAEYGRLFIDRAVADIVAALDEGRTSELDAHNALAATEIIFAIWESSRKRGRVEFPLDIEDNPLDAMVESGDLDPEVVDD